MPRISELREIGNAAFAQGAWEKALMAYTKAIELDPTDVALYSNRSAAHLKAGDTAQALQDAQTCIDRKPDYPKGYARKAAVLMQLQKYGSAVQTYQQGIQHCADTAQLQLGLKAARKAQQDWGALQRQRRKSCAARRASQVFACQHAQPSYAGFLDDKRRELKLEIAALEAELDFLDLLNKMTDEAKMKLLFNVVDADRDGKVSAAELGFALRRQKKPDDNNEDKEEGYNPVEASMLQPPQQSTRPNPGGHKWSDESKDDDDDNDSTKKKLPKPMSINESIEKAVNMVAIFDTDGDLRLNYKEFEEYIKVLLTELDADTTFSDFANYMIVQNVFAQDRDALKREEAQINRESVDEQVKTRGQLLEMLANERLLELFELLDTEGTRELSFANVAVALYPLIQDLPEQARKTLERLLLMMDQDDSEHDEENQDDNNTPARRRSSHQARRRRSTSTPERTIGYEQFGHLMMGIVAARGTSFDQVADELVLVLTDPDDDEDEEKSEEPLPPVYNEPYVPPNKGIAAGILGQYRPEEDAQQRKPSGGSKSKRRGKKGPAGVDAATYKRMQKLFDLWDTDENGKMDRRELTAGLVKFEQSTGVAPKNNDNDTTAIETRLFSEFDKDGDYALDREEFVGALTKYAELCEEDVDLNELMDFMCLAAVMPEPRLEEFQQAYRASISVSTRAALADSNATAGTYTSHRAHAMRRPIRLEYESASHDNTTDEASLDGSSDDSSNYQDAKEEDAKVQEKDEDSNDLYSVTTYNSSRELVEVEVDSSEFVVEEKSDEFTDILIEEDEYVEEILLSTDDEDLDEVESVVNLDALIVDVETQAKGEPIVTKPPPEPVSPMTHSATSNNTSVKSSDYFDAVSSHTGSMNPKDPATSMTSRRRNTNTRSVRRKPSSTTNPVSNSERSEETEYSWYSG